MIYFFDDEVYYVQSYVEALQEAGYAVTLESDVHVAARFLRANSSKVDLLIVDVLAPVGGRLPKGFDAQRVAGGSRTGMELIRSVNEDENGRRMKKIVLTNVLVDDLTRNGEKLAGVLGFYAKPSVLPSELVAAVKGIIARND